MDIPALSMGMSQVSLQNSVQLAILGKVMDTSEITSDQMTNMMNDMSVEPYKGQNIDITI